MTTKRLRKPTTDAFPLAMLVDGSAIQMDRLTVGTELMGPDSKPRRVLSVDRGVDTLFRVVPNKGAPWLCGANQLLALHRNENKWHGPVALTASDVASCSQRTRRGYTLYRAPALDFLGCEVREPWLFGYWLGDGASRLSDLRISSADREVADEAAVIARQYGLFVRRHECKRGATPCCFYVFSSGKPGRGGNALLALFKSLGVHQNKHIPHGYKTACVADRRELLAGLLDSDGHVYRGTGAGSAVFTNTNERLATDVAFVARSLGLAAYLVSEVRQAGYATRPTSYWNVSMSGDIQQIPTKIERKRAPLRRQRKSVLRTGLALEPAGHGETRSFVVDGDGLFLLDDFTVAHDSGHVRRLAETYLARRGAPREEETA